MQALGQGVCVGAGEVGSSVVGARTGGVGVGLLSGVGGPLPGVGGLREGGAGGGERGEVFGNRLVDAGRGRKPGWRHFFFAEDVVYIVWLVCVRADVWAAVGLRGQCL